MNVAQARQETSRFISLFILYLLRPDDMHRSKVLDYAKTMKDNQTDLAMRKLKEFQEGSPLLWFMILRNIRMGQYDVTELVERNVINPQRESGELRDELCRVVVQTSTYRNSRWLMVEHPIGGQPSGTIILHGRCRDKLPSLPRTSENDRWYVIANATLPITTCKFHQYIIKKKED